MGISQYPRSGRRIAPALLCEVLSIPLPSYLQPENQKEILFCDLDESAWVRFGFKTCCDLAKAVIRRVASEFACGRFYVSGQHLPKPPGNLVLEDLELEVRTFNCLSRLRRQRHLSQAEDWASITIEDLLGISAFGAKSLVDFLSSYETAISLSQGQQTFSYTPDQLVVEENRALRSWCENPKNSLSPEIMNLHIPRPKLGLSLEDLGLKYRTYKRLRRAGYARDPQGLGDATVRHLLSIRGFGITSLLDLVAALSRPLTLKADLGLSPDDRVTLTENQILRRWCKRPVFPIPKKVQSCYLPKPPEGFRLEQLSLNERAYNCLENEGFGARPQALGDLKVGDIIQVWGIGDKTIVLLLECLLQVSKSGNAEALKSACPEPQQPTEEHFVSLESTLAKLTTFQQNLRGNRNSRLVTRYFGLDGNGGCTLQTAGEEFGVTKERVRQISSKTAQRLRKLNHSIPVLESALEFVAKSVPNVAEIIESDLATQGYSAQAFRLEGLIQAARLFSKEVTFTVQMMDGQRMVVKTEGAQLAKEVRRIAIKSIRHWGVVTISDIAAQVVEEMKSPVEANLLTVTLSSLKGFSWLDQSTGWFWLRHLPKNRLVGKVRKILSVANRIDISELRTGVGRHYRMKGYAPPRRVLLELCKQLEGCSVEDNYVFAKPALEWSNVLSGIERTMVEVLKEHGPLMQTAEFENICVSRGMNRSTFYVYLDYSAVFEKYANGVFGLRGACIPPGLIESLRPRRQGPVTVRLDHGWTEDGRIFVSYRLSRPMLLTGCFGIPGSLKEFLAGEFRLAAADGQNIGKLVVKKHSAWGLGPFFTRRGGEEGDVLLLMFDLTGHVVIASIGDESLLDQSVKIREVAKTAIDF